MKIINKIDTFLAAIEKSILVFSLCTLIGISLLQIISRYFFHHTFLWIDPVTRFTVLIFALFGASLGIRKDYYIGLEVLTNFVSSRKLQIIRLVTYIFTLIVILFLFSASIEFLETIKMEKDAMFFNLSKIYFALIIPLGFAFLTLRILIRMIQILTNKQAASNSEI